MARKTPALACSAQALAEYGVILMLGVCICISALSYLRDGITSRLDCLSDGIKVGHHNHVKC